KQENIASVAGILLKVGDEIVGVMFINYRRMYKFSRDEQKVIETLASAAAYAIKNQRSLQSWLDTLSDIERELITTLEEEKLLCKIVQRAVEKTEADFGSIRLLVKNNQQLDTKAFYPENTTRKVLQRTSIKQGITGWVAQTRESARVNDVQEDSRYVGDKDNVRSELCVPILDEQENLIGVLNVESNQVNAFDPKELQLLEQLADLAVIAIQNATKQEQLAKAEVMAALGDIAGPLVHRTNNNVGAIRVLAQDICDEADENIKSFAIEIVSIAEQVIEYSQRMRSWIRDKPQVLNLEEIIQETLLQIQVPRNIDQNINLDSDLYQVCAGKQQLINVFDNLIQNAINAMPKGGKLFIRGSNFKINTNNWIKVCILDTGVGIALIAF
ncbi:MAG: GAF domain-containing protein, partial [Cyanobacteria bacterium J06641_2]